MDEQALVKRAKAGDYEAFQTLVDAYAPRLYALARRITGHDADAEDVVQTTFLKALEHLRDFRQDAGFGTWTHVIATNTALKLLRKRGRQWTGGNDDASLPMPQRIADWRPGVEQQVHDREFRQLLTDTLDALDEKYRVVFVLREMENMSVRDTATALGISESNVKVRLMRARLMLREKLTEALGEGPLLKPPHLEGDHDHATLLES